MVDRNLDQLSVRRQCEILKIWRSNVYYNPIAPSDESIIANEIHELWLAKPYYGYRRITAALQRQGHNVNEKYVLRIMRETGIRAIYPKRRTTILDAENKVYPYLLKGLEVKAPDDVWETDITYIRMPQGFMYFLAIIDVYSRYCTGWSFLNTMEAVYCKEMLQKTFERGRKPLILNTDQGAQFTSPTWINCVQAHNVKVSMDGKGRWADNIYIERFWRTLKYEHVLIHSFKTVKEAKSSIDGFIQIYNDERLHQSLSYATPAEVYGGSVKILSFTI